MYKLQLVITVSAQSRALEHLCLTDSTLWYWFRPATDWNFLHVPESVLHVLDHDWT